MKNTKYKIQNTRYKDGFVSLFAVLISLIILAITIGISNIAYKENVLAFSAREGSYAFFAADTGLECGLYQDSLGSVFVSVPTNPNFDCADIQITPNQNVITGEYTFQFEIDMDNKSRCVEVSVDKDVLIDDLYNPDPAAPQISATRIYSNGYNINCADVDNILDIPNNRIVNRLLRATYPNPPPPPPPVGP